MNQVLHKIRKYVSLVINKAHASKKVSARVTLFINIRKYVSIWSYVKHVPQNGSA